MMTNEEVRGIIRNNGKENFNKDTFELLTNHCLNNGNVNEFIYFVLKLFSESTTFNMADYRYSTYIKPLLQHFNKQQLIELIRVIDNNPQIYNRVRSYSDNNEILKICEQLLDSDFDFRQYKNFVVDEAAIN